jgi:hypothetical protein
MGEHPLSSTHRPRWVAVGSIAVSATCLCALAACYGLRDLRTLGALCALVVATITLDQMRQAPRVGLPPLLPRVGFAVVAIATLIGLAIALEGALRPLSPSLGFLVAAGVFFLFAAAVARIATRYGLK